METSHLQEGISPLHESSGERNREEIFHSIIMQKLLGEMEDVLAEHDFSDDQIEAFARSLRALSAERILGALAIPYELKGQLFKNAHELIEGGKETVESFVKRLDANAQKYGFTLGYHISKARIPMRPDAHNPERMTWNILGNELDDRDDMKMAYYSLDYENLFRKNRGTFLYLVRAETGESTAHKRDLKNNWGRVSQLSIIAEFDLIEVEEQIQKLLREMEDKDASE